ncbi:putative transmembrane protein [Boletus reticuloceps]|uniref:Autophagy-related protein 9 n=1 Tax=Boletus reticuloceps TaxID=495285 RepID=A0A8I2YP08_9AGAM|nr:putative transmembrane protein [Boletus reticuloceps]
MSRNYQGYTQASQSPVMEEENESEEHDIEAGHAIPRPSRARNAFVTAQSKRKVSWETHADVAEMNPLRPNIRHEDGAYDQDVSDDEVPQSFMIEASRSPHKPSPSSAGGTNKGKARSQPLHSTSARSLPRDVHRSLPVSIPPRPSELDIDVPPQPPSNQPTSPKPLRGLDAYERALWNWVNVYNLDAFLQEHFMVYSAWCIDYNRITRDKATRLSDAVIDHCVARFSGMTLLFFLLFTAFYVWQIISFAFEVTRLVDMYRFYTHLLRVPDVKLSPSPSCVVLTVSCLSMQADIQTISWPEVVRRIGAIREDNPITAISSAVGDRAATPATASLDAHDIANRIMRQENYLIALFNKELLDLRVPLPPTLKRILHQAGDEGQGRTLTKVLEWNLRFCLMEYLFDSRGRVRKVFLKSKNRAILIEGLRRRFVFMGILNAIFAPFIVLYMIMYSFFRYFDEYHNNPSSIGSRRYTPFAQWKFREFNELSHLFTRRLDESYPLANIYIGQFPNEKIAIIMRFVAFVAGSFAAVLVLVSVLDPELAIHFEVTPHRTVLFYITVFASILGVARGMIPEENRVFDPELLMTEVIQYTHYMPDEWKGQLHAKQVHQEFGELFTLKVVNFLQEIVSVVTTPFVLWFSLPPCAPAIIDFFHDFTVWVPGRGYICSFAEFDFKRHGNVKVRTPLSQPLHIRLTSFAQFGAPTKIQDERMLSREGKMEKSFLNFKAANPDWNPSDPTGSLYLSRIADLSARRRTLTASRAGLDSTVLLNEGKKDLTERAQEYDRALRQSQHMAFRRKYSGGSVLASGGGVTPAWQSTMGISSLGDQGIGMAETAVLGDSHGSVLPPPAPPSVQDEGRAVDGEVDSTLGDSYVDGNTNGTKPYESQQEGVGEEEELEDGGVLGILAQIYATRGPRGPVPAM